jgi:hypothetical protein
MEISNIINNLKVISDSFNFFQIFSSFMLLAVSLQKPYVRFNLGRSGRGLIICFLVDFLDVNCFS